MTREEFLCILNLPELWNNPENIGKKRISLWGKECLIKEILLGQSRRIDIACDCITLRWRSRSGMSIKFDNEECPDDPTIYKISSVDELIKITSLMTSNEVGWECDAEIWCDTHLKEG
jgi:hypothetical protein